MKEMTNENNYIEKTNIFTKAMFRTLWYTITRPSE